MRGLSSLTDAAAAEAIGALWLERVLEPVSHAGRRAREGLRPFAPGQEAQARAAIAEVLATAERCTQEQARALRAVVRELPEPSETLVRVTAGGALDDVDAYQLLRFLDGLRAVRERGSGRVPERLLPAPFDALHALLARGRQRAGGFYLDDVFDGSLAQARAAAEEARQAYARERARLREAAEASLGDAVREEGEFSVLRHIFDGPVPEGVRVVREAATFRILELLGDAPAMAAQVLLEEAREGVAAAEERVRALLAREVRAYADALAAEVQRVGELDLHLAAVAFAIAEHAVAPEIFERPVLTIVEGRLLPLAQRLAEHGRRYVPISFELDGQLVVTGPNMGGKSAALRTAGFIQLCAQWGLPVPARAARIGLVERICWLGAAENADRGGLLSSFAHEIVALAQALDGRAEPRLLLVDEFARTTSPAQGRALVVGLLETLRERGELALVTTHFSGVAEAAGVTHYAVVGLRRAFAAAAGAANPGLEGALRAIGEAMDYRLAPAAHTRASEGDAIALARLLGLDEQLTARAARELRRLEA